jgi:glycosyltransferase involved in cell wall biosynthesis
VTRVLYFGMIREYKGVDLLLEAVASTDLAIDVTIVGECTDPALRARLGALAAAVPRPDRLSMKLAFATEPELTDHLMGADFAVFPFRSVTSSSSVGHALAAGLPVIIPALATLADVPTKAAIRYVPAADAGTLADALSAAAAISGEQRAAMAAAASRAARGRPWSDAAAATWRAYDDLLAHRPATSTPVDVREVAR